MPDFLLHLQEAIDRISEYTSDLDEGGFLTNRLVQDAVIRNIEIIGEACNNIRKHDPEFVQAHASIPWGFAIGMRNVVSHGYFKVDLDAVWQTNQRDLPELGRQVMELRGGLSATSRTPVDP